MCFVDAFVYKEMYELEHISDISGSCISLRYLIEDRP